MYIYWLRRFIVAFLIVSVVGSTFQVDAQANQEFSHQNTQLIHLPLNADPVNLPSGFQLITSTSTSLVLEIIAPSYNMEAASIEGQSCQVLNADGYFPASLPGEPGLLSSGIIVGIPLDTDPSISIQSIDIVSLPGQHRLCPVPTPMLQQDPVGLATYQGDELIENPLIYSQDTFTPTLPVELHPSGMIRSQRVARLGFMPFQYNPVRQELRFIRQIRIELQFGYYGYNDTESGLIDEGSFEPILQNLLINYDQAKPWRFARLPETLASSEPSPEIPLDQSVYKIQIDQDGLYQITYADLQSAGLPVDTLDPRTFQLLNHGAEVPVFVYGEEDGFFNSGDYLLFYGQKITTKYTNTNIYWLGWGNANGQRMATQDGSVHDGNSPISFINTLHLEEDHLYVKNSPSGPQNDLWYWLLLNAYDGPVSQDFTFSLQNLNTNALTATVRGLIKGYYAEPQHHTILSLNGVTIDDHTWSSGSEYAFSIEVPAADLVEGANTLTVMCPRDGGITLDMELVNWFEIDYEHTFVAENNLLKFNKPDQWKFQVGGFSSNAISVFEITNPSAPIRLLGGTIIPDGPFFQISYEQQLSGQHNYWVSSPSSWLAPISITQDEPSNLKDPTNGADYLIISHANFLEAVQSLAAYRASQGLRFKIVNVQDVYDEFNGGIFDPQAIHDFLAFAYSNWMAPAPSYVLLVGDGNYDFKNNLGNSGPNYIPPLLGEYDPWIGETSSDNRFVTISGDDTLPDMAIGRLPANNVDEITAMVDKDLSYEQNSAQGDWNTHLLFVADNADAGGNFPVLSDNIADHMLPPEYLAEKVYYGLPPYENVADAQSAILNTINSGQLLVHYTGHGSVAYWASEQLLSVDSLSGLANVGQYPLFLPMTCQEGYFIAPGYPSLAESLVRAGSKGAIASWSPTGFGLSNGHDLLAQGLYQAFFNDNLIQFGLATNYAKYYLFANSDGFRDLLDTYMLFGDPATRLKTNPSGPVVESLLGEAKSSWVQLDWMTLNETWLVGFNLYRANSIDGERQKVNNDLILAVKPGQNLGVAYQFNDVSVAPGKDYYYWLELVQVGGIDLSDPVQVTIGYWLNLPLVVR